MSRDAALVTDHKVLVIQYLCGIGLFFFEALTRLDYPVVQSVNLIIAALVVGLNLLIDISYAFLDPRIRY